MNYFGKYQKRLAKYSGKTTKEVKKIWEEICEKIDETKFDTYHEYLFAITKEVKKKLKIEEKYIALDKFKKFLK